MTNRMTGRKREKGKGSRGKGAEIRVKKEHRAWVQTDQSLSFALLFTDCVALG